MPDVQNLSAVPGLSRDLVDALDRLWPERCPNPMQAERAIWMYAGARDVVRKLRTILEKQENANNAPFSGPDPRRLARL